MGNSGSREEADRSRNYSPFNPFAEHAVGTDVVPHTVVSQVVLPEIVGFLPVGRLRLSDAEAAASTVEVTIDKAMTHKHLAALTAHGDRVETVCIATTAGTAGFIVAHGGHLTGVSVRASLPDVGSIVQLVGTNCPLLLSLDVEYCRNLSDKLVNCCNLSDAAVIAVATNCPQLQSLNVNCCGDLSDAAVIAVATNCPQLQSLNVECCILSDAAVIAVAASCPHLQSLNVECCYHLSDAAVIAVATNCPQLQSLNVECCCDLSDAAVIAVATNCPLLQSLKVERCNLSDAAVIAVATNCPLLHSLDVNYCSDLSDAAVFVVVERCPLLRSFGVYYCPKLTPSAEAAASAVGNRR